MRSIRICDDLEECQLLWQRALRNDNVFHLWETRKCFQDAFHRTPCFIVCEDAEGVSGLLPLSRIDETDTLAFFPGETWHGKTWLERNRIVARSPEIFEALLGAVPSDAHIRYVEGECLPASLTDASLTDASLTDASLAEASLAEAPLPFAEASVDEIGYLFFPQQHAFSFEAYLNGIPGKTRKRLQREPNTLREDGVTFRYDSRRDIEQLFRMNLGAFGEDSYFHDERFLHGFEALIAELDRRGALRVTTVLVGGAIAAVDVGAVWHNTYTVLAGGTNPGFPGVAKLINFHHLEIACRERFDAVDFLCGDFSWKQRFRLIERPLYQIRLGIGDVRKRYETIRSTGILTHV